MSDIIYNQNGIPFDIDALITDVNGKAEIDFTNVSNLGKSRGAGWAMPSDTYEDLTLGASGTTYTAPANGYFYVMANATGANDYINLTNNNSGINAHWDFKNSTAGTSLYVPAQKGEVAQLGGYGYSVTVLRFIYAQGSESEAN